MAVGLATAGARAYGLASGTVTAGIRGRTIGYGVKVPWTPPARTGCPFATPGALLLAGDRRLRTLGMVLAAGAPACSALWRPEFAATRCVFAAVASLLVPGRARGREPAAVGR